MINLKLMQIHFGKKFTMVIGTMIVLSQLQLVLFLTKMLSVWLDATHMVFWRFMNFRDCVFFWLKILGDILDGMASILMEMLIGLLNSKKLLAMIVFKKTKAFFGWTLTLFFNGLTN